MRDKFTPVLERAIHDGEQRVFKFDNGYGASVVRHSFSYGGNTQLWELAVLKFTDPNDVTKYKLTYDTPITDDVIGHMSWSEVEKVLGEIESLEVTG